MAESGSFAGNYEKVQGIVRGTRKLGAYGIAADDWPHMAAAAGMAGARWQDRAAQDFVAKRTVDRLFQIYGDWGLVALAWRAGEAVADAIAADPRLLDQEDLKPLAGYVNEVMDHASKDLAVNQVANPDGSPVNPDAINPMFTWDVARLEPREIDRDDEDDEEITPPGVRRSNSAPTDEAAIAGVMGPEGVDATEADAAPSTPAGQALVRLMYAMRDRVRNVPEGMEAELEEPAAAVTTEPVPVTSVSQPMPAGVE